MHVKGIAVVPGAQLSSQQMVLSLCLSLATVVVWLDSFCTEKGKRNSSGAGCQAVGFRVLFCQEESSPQRLGEVIT